MSHRALLALALLAPVALAGCTDQQITPPSQRTCPADGGGLLVVAVQTGGLAPHPEVFTVRADGTATGVVLAAGQPPEGEPVGIPTRALHNVTADGVLETLAAAGQPETGTWNVSLAFQGLGDRASMEALCQALTMEAPIMEARYPDPDCRDGTTLRLTVWSQGGLEVSEAVCQGGQGTAFEDVRLGLHGVLETARTQAGAPG